MEFDRGETVEWIIIENQFHSAVIYATR
jgi:hypothetical protein